MSSRSTIKTAAKKIGIPVAVYEFKVRSGLKWCYKCREWKWRKGYSIDKSRGDGLKAYCIKCSKIRYKKTYQPKPKRIFRGRSFVPARDDDKKQARRRINYFVEKEIIQNPNSLSCVDCGHVHKKGGRRHEYDHYLGYDAENHEKVQPVCSKCHHVREKEKSSKGIKPLDLSRAFSLLPDPE